jgi:glycerophosphoryl diester phosphodiesterase
MKLPPTKVEKPIIWTHRGSPHPEHTLFAFESAWNSGIRNFEIDIRKTKDHQVVLAHDSSISRLTGFDHCIEDLTLAELQQFLINGHPWTTLEELLVQFPRAQISIDFKSDDVVDRAIAILRNYQNFDLVLGSFSRKRTLLLRKEFPNFTSAATAVEVLNLRLGRFPKSLRAQNCFAMVPQRHKGIDVLTPTFISTCQGAGIPIYVWVINDPQEMCNLVQLGISGVVTDFYEAALAVKYPLRLPATGH